MYEDRVPVGHAARPYELVQGVVEPQSSTLDLQSCERDDLVRAGKVRYIGSSNHAGWTKMRALATSDRLGVNRPDHRALD